MITIAHASAYAHDPRSAAEHLAALTGGRAAPFQPLDGAWVTHFDGGAFIELYPRTARVALRDGEVSFEPMPAAATGAGTHFNLRVDPSRAELEAICARRGLQHGWRGWGGFLDVWLDEGLLIELACSR